MAISVEVRIGDNAGMMNIGIPSIIVKMLRQKFDQQWSVRRTQATEEGAFRILRRLKSAQMMIDTRLQGQTMTVSDLLRVEEGQVLTFDYPVNRPLDLLINGKLKYQGPIATSGRKRAFQLGTPVVQAE